MPFAPYRQALRLPGVARLLLFAVLARIPQTASGVILTLHVVTTLGRGYGAAGAVAAVGTIGMGIGFPWRGRLVDRSGLRRAVLPAAVVSTAAWALAPFASYPHLLALTFLGGLFALPVFTLTRQSLAAMVPPEQRRSAFSLDSMGTELSFIGGPTLGVLLATQLSTRTALFVVAGLTAGVGIALLVLNPPTRSAGPAQHPEAEQPAARPGRWFGARLVAVLAVAAGATVVLAGTDVAIVAHLREAGAVQLTGMVFAAWGIGSIVGGTIYGSRTPHVSPFALLLGLAVLTVPVGLVPGAWLLVLSILPAAALCAPVITATLEEVSRLVPERVRGEAMGWHGAALQAGSALGAPMAGAVMDGWGAWAGFALVGSAGAVIAVVGLVVQRLVTPMADTAAVVADATEVAAGSRPR